MFKNWLEGDLQDAINEYGPEIVDDVRLPIRGHTFLERFLEAVILANTGCGFSSKELHQRKLAAMKALVNEKPYRSDKKNDIEGLIWMAEQYVWDRHEVKRGRLEKWRSEEALADEYAMNDDGEIDEGMSERLEKQFSSDRDKLIKMVDLRGMAIERVQHAALCDLAERLEIMGIDMWPDD